MKVRTEKYTPTVDTVFTAGRQRIVHTLEIMDAPEFKAFNAAMGKLASMKVKGRKGGELTTDNGKVIQLKINAWKNKAINVEGYEHPDDNKDIMEHENWKDLVVNTTPSLCIDAVDRLVGLFDVDDDESDASFEIDENESDSVAAPFPENNSKDASAEE